MPLRERGEGGGYADSSESKFDVVSRAGGLPRYEDARQGEVRF